MSSHVLLILLNEWAIISIFYLSEICKKNAILTSTLGGVWWLSGRVLASRCRGFGFKLHQEALCCVLMQDTLSSS